MEYWIATMSAILLIGSSMAAVIRYIREKNRDLNEKILNEVYAPLYQYIIKQEYIRHLKPDELPVNEHPIFSS